MEKEFRKDTNQTKEEFLSQFSKDTVDLDEMFTDHDYTLTMDYDGTINPGGLIG